MNRLLRPFVVLGLLAAGGAAADPSLVGYGTSGLTFLVSNAGVVTERVRIMPDGKVGIGTSSPETLLDLNGTLKVSGTLGNTYLHSNGSTIEFTRAGNNFIRASSASGGLAFDAGGMNTRLFIMSSGAVGISKTNPLAKLDVLGTISASDAIQVGTSMLICGSGIPGAIRYNSGNLQYCNGSSWATLGTITPPGASGDIIYNNGSAFAVDAGQLFWDETFHRLGIGNGAPRAAVHLTGSLAIGASSTSISTTLSGENSIQINTDTYFGGTYNDHSGYLIYSVMPSSWGTARLNFARSTNWGNYDTSEPVLSLGSNVGIGTTAPGYRLDVSGSIRAGTGTGNKGTVVLSEGGGGNTGYVSYHSTAGTRVGFTGYGFAGAGLYHATDNQTPLVFSTSSTERVRFTAEGNVGVGVSSPNAKLDVSGTISATTIIAAPPMMILVDEKATTTVGGACTAGAWLTRTINTERGNTISGAALSSNQFTLPSGTYHIDAESNGYATNRFQIRLFNVTDAAVTNYGMSVYSAGSSAATISRLKTIITIASSKTFRIEGRCNTSSNSNDFGVPTNFGGPEVYSMVEITKLQ